MKRIVRRLIEALEFALPLAESMTWQTIDNTDKAAVKQASKVLELHKRTLAEAKKEAHS